MSDLVKQEQSKRRGNPTWQKGQSGNPFGRPRKEHSLTSLLADELKKIPQLTDKAGKKNRKTWEQLLAEALPPAAYKELSRGGTRLLELIYDRVEGKAPLIDMRTQNLNISPETVQALRETVQEIRQIGNKEGQNV